MTTEFTATLRLNKPDFRDPGWATLVNDNMDNIDRAIQAALAGANFTIWANTTLWQEGSIAIDVNTTPASYWICNVTHTSANSPTTFAQDRAAHSTYWSAFLFNYRARGAWTHDTQYLINDIAYDSSLGITGICKIAHISNHAGTINDDAANWDYIVNLPSSLPATSITYNPTVSGLGVTNVQAAIDAVDAINDTQTTNITANTASIVTNTTNIATNTASIATLVTQQQRDGWDVGDVKLSLNSGPRSGWINMNDGTIGSALSGATVWAAAAAITLYTIIWNACSNALAPVTGGRGANAAADFAANKPMALTKAAGRAIICAGSGSGLTTRNVGEFSGEETHILTLSETATHNHGGSTGTESVSHTHLYNNSNVSIANQTGGGTFALPLGDSSVASQSESVLHSHSISNAGSGSAHNNMQPYVVYYLHIRAVP